MKVTSVRYFETRRGLGYQCKTNIKDIEIWNDGNGGGTYVDGALKDIKLLKEYTEDELEKLIDEYENNS